jgi:Protein of unknown function (DUF4240)
MDTTDFWSLIETARTGSSGSEEAVAQSLVDRLAATSKLEILEYHHQFERVHSAIYRWDVWAAAYLIGGGCSDDSFIDFRAGLIAQGREWYERAAACPDTLADHPDVIAAAHASHNEALFNEPFNYAAPSAYMRITGISTGSVFYDDYREFQRQHPHPEPTNMGEAFDFEDHAQMRARLPRLSGLDLDPRR